MFFGESLEEVVIQTLINRGPSTVKELEDALKSHGNHSQRAIYRALERLEEINSVIKLKSFYFVEIGWLSETANFWQKAFEKQIKHISLDQFLSDGATKNVWKLKSLERADAFWLQLIVALMESKISQEIYNWSPHPWYFFCTTTFEQRYLQALKKWGGSIYRVIGGSTWLDHYPEKIWAESPGKVIYAKTSTFGNQNTYVTVVDEYIINLKLTPAQGGAIGKVFEQSSLGSEIDKYAFDRIMNDNTVVTIELIKNPAQAQALIAKFKKYL